MTGNLLGLPTNIHAEDQAAPAGGTCEVVHPPAVDLDRIILDGFIVDDFTKKHVDCWRASSGMKQPAQSTTWHKTNTVQEKLTMI